jgi:KDO2-lipid IV(A) lauroyltransferase
MLRDKMWKYYVLRLGFLLLGRLPLRVLYGIAHLVGDGAYFLRRNARSDVIDNMRQVLGPEASDEEVRAAAREVFRNATRYYADLYHIPHMNVEEAFQELELVGLEHLEAARATKRGIVVVSAHFGNPEMAVQGLAARGFFFFALTEPLHPQALSDFTHWLRSRHGHEYRTLGFNGIKEALQRLKRGGMVAILLDRDVAGTGMPMRLCGREARVPVGAVDLALRTDSLLLPAWTRRIDGYRFHVRVNPPLEVVRTGDFEKDIRVNSQRLLDIFEGELREHPAQWAVLEPIWREAEEPAGTKLR